MPQVPRFPWRVLAVSTVLALLAAIGTYVLLDDGGGDADVTSRGTVSLVPEGDVDPASATFTEFDGAEVDLTSLRGGPVLVNFFGSYCTPCITEMPALEEVHQEVGDQITFLGLAVADRAEEAQEMVVRTGVTYRTAQDRDSSVVSALGATVLPTTVLLDADGAIVATHAGDLSADELRELLAAELGITS